MGVFSFKELMPPKPVRSGNIGCRQPMLTQRKRICRLPARLSWLNSCGLSPASSQKGRCLRPIRDRARPRASVFFRASVSLKTADKRVALYGVTKKQSANAANRTARCLPPAPGRNFSAWGLGYAPLDRIAPREQGAVPPPRSLSRMASRYMALIGTFTWIVAQCRSALAA